MNRQFETLTRADVVVSYKAKFSLIALWVFAVIIFVVMILFNSISISSNAAEKESYLNIFYPLADDHSVKSAFNKEKSNKKFFLTRLPSSQPQTDTRQDKQSIQMLVIRKVKIETRKSGDGFQVKPLPR